jgi:hypothetical protein
MKPIHYEPILIDAKLLEHRRIAPHPNVAGSHVWQHIATKHEGVILYSKQWNFFVRATATADLRASLFFRDYETTNANIDELLRDCGFPWAKAETEEEIWQRIANVWQWIREHVDNDGAAYATISSDPDAWPSIADYAAYYMAHGKRLPWAACFSKAHLFSTLLGRVVYPRFRFGIALAHHTESGAPPTASHVYVGAYVADRWYYLDATEAPALAFPSFASRRSIGVPSFTSVDYQHPFDFIPVPLSGFTQVPLLPD